MTYVLVSRAEPGASPLILAEMTARELAAYRATEAARGFVSYTVTAQRARQWVRSGGVHSTGLWIDSEGRIRKA